MDATSYLANSMHHIWLAMSIMCIYNVMYMYIATAYTTCAYMYVHGVCLCYTCTHVVGETSKEADCEGYPTAVHHTHHYH